MRLDMFQVMQKAQRKTGVHSDHLQFAEINSTLAESNPLFYTGLNWTQ